MVVNIREIVPLVAQQSGERAGPSSHKLTNTDTRASDGRRSGADLLDSLNNYISMHDVPSSLAQRLRMFVIHSKGGELTRHSQSCIDGLSPSLQVELLLHSNHKSSDPRGARILPLLHCAVTDTCYATYRWDTCSNALNAVSSDNVRCPLLFRACPSRMSVTSVWFLSSIDPDCVVCLARLLTLQCFSPGELTPKHNVYFLRRGHLMLGPWLLTIGSSWGDDVLLANERNMLPYNGRAIDFVDLTLLSRDALHMVRAWMPPRVELGPTV